MRLWKETLAVNMSANLIVAFSAIMVAVDATPVLKKAITFSFSSTPT